MRVTSFLYTASALIVGFCALTSAQDLSSNAIARGDARTLDTLPEASIVSPNTAGNGINYHGGPVMLGTVRMYYIWYGTWDAAARSILTNFANGIGGSAYFNIETSYVDGSNAALSNSVSYGGSALDSYSLGKSLSDADIATVVSSALKNGNLPTDSNAVYFVLTSPDVMETSGFAATYCAWHAWANLNGSNIKYAFVGDASAIKPQACSVQTSSSPNNNPGVDAMVSMVAHELDESVNDPNFNSWFDSTGEESADKCSWTFGNVYHLANGSMANVNLGGHDFLIQENWVNAAGGSCALSYGMTPPHSLTSGLAAVSGSLIGSGDSSTAPASLTAEGNMDWVHWGDAGRKAGVTAQISNYTVVGTGGVLKYSIDPRLLSWTDGTPTKVVTNNPSGVYVDAGRGLSITAPADTSVRTLIVHVAGLNSGGTLTAHLSDNSAADFTDTTGTVSGQYDRNYKFTYQAATAGQTLTVIWKMTSGTGNVRLNGAALSGPPPNVPTITATAGGSQNATIGDTFAVPLQATVKDSNNAPMSGAPVTFTVPGNGASGTFNGSATINTDSNGVATAPALKANSIAGAYTVVASTPSAAATASFTLTNNTGPAANIVATGGTPQNATINTAFGTLLSATVKDSGGNPVSGASVTFTAPSSGATAAFGGGSTTTASTNGNGVATATALTANGTVGNYLVTASVSGVAGVASFALGNVAVPVGGGISLTQHADVNSGINVSSITVAFKAANAAGNWIGVAIYGGQGTAHTFTVTDTNGNVYQHALTQANTIGDATMGIYYAENIKAGKNTIKIQPDHPGYLRVVALEYSGVATTHSLDVTSSAENTGLPNSGTVTTTADGDLLLGVEITGDANSVSAGAGYKIEDQVPGLPGTKLSVEDQIQKSAGPAAATITSSNNWGWAMGLATFKKAP